MNQQEDLGDKRGGITNTVETQNALPASSANPCIAVRVSANDWERAYLLPSDYLLELLCWLQVREIRPKE